MSPRARRRRNTIRFHLELLGIATVIVCFLWLFQQGLAAMLGAIGFQVLP